MALDRVPISMMTPMDSASETAPSNPNVGQRWFRLSTGITYQYTNDGTSSFWLDVSSGGIGTSASRGVDFVGDTDPHKTTNGAGLAIGSVYYNREKNRYFVCTTATTNNNVWSGRYAGLGGVETTYTSGSTHYRVHTFLESGTFYIDDTITVDMLIVAGGGGGGGYFGGGAGAGGVRVISGYSLTSATNTLAITVGAGGKAGLGWGVSNSEGSDGGNSSVGSLYSATGGGGGGATGQPGRTGGSGGGTGKDRNATAAAGNAGGYSPVEGYAGGSQTSGSASYQGASGGGGAGEIGEAGTNPSSQTESSGDGGDGIQNLYRTGSNVWYGGGGAGSRNFDNAGSGAVGGNGGGGTANNSTDTNTVDGSPNTGGGGAGGTNTANTAGDGGTGIVVIRYALN